MGEKLVYDGRIIDLDSLSKEVEKLNKKLHIEDNNER